MGAAAAAMTRSMGAERRRTHDICGEFPSLLALQAEPSRRRSQKLRDANEIVGSGGEYETTPDAIEHESIGLIVKLGDVEGLALTGAPHGGSRLEAASSKN